MTNEMIKLLSEEKKELYFSGYATAIMDYGIWHDGVQTIGCMETEVKVIIEELAKELNIKGVRID